MRRQRKGKTPAVLLVALSLWGCGSSEADKRLPVHPVSGRVEVAGKPAAGVFVMLRPDSGTAAAGKGVCPSGTTDAEGVFHVSTYDQADGAPAGAYRLTMQWLHEPAAKPKGPPAGFAPPSDRWRGKFNNPDQSRWPVTVVEGSNELPTITVP